MNNSLSPSELAESAKQMAGWADLFEDEVIPVPPDVMARRITQGETSYDPFVTSASPPAQFVLIAKNKGALQLFDVVIPNTPIALLTDIVDKPVGEYIVNKLNSGVSLADKKIIGIILMCAEMSRIINTIEDCAKKRIIVLNNKDYDQAKSYDTELTTLREDAAKIKTKLYKYIV